MNHEFTRADHIHIARVMHHQLRARMHTASWHDFWFTMFEWAQEHRRQAARTIVQGDLFSYSKKMMRAIDALDKVKP